VESRGGGVGEKVSGCGGTKACLTSLSKSPGYYDGVEVIMLDCLGRARKRKRDNVVGLVMMEDYPPSASVICEKEKKRKDQEQTAGEAINSRKVGRGSFLRAIESELGERKERGTVPNGRRVKTIQSGQVGGDLERGVRMPPCRGLLCCPERKC